MYLISVSTHFNYDDFSLCCCLHYASIHPYGDCPRDLEPGGKGTWRYNEEVD